MPLVLQPSTVVRTDVLPTKPLIIAHRGGSHYAPENTIAAGDYADYIGVDGWEVDVQISYDGVPFLMHDDTLERTTNVEDIYPSRAEEDASSFNISELFALNAGEWFTTTDPYGTIEEGKVPSILLPLYNITRVPSLESALDFSRVNDLIVNVDFKAPPESHPYYESYFDVCLGVLLNASIDENIWITSYNPEWLEIAMATAPNMKAVLSLELSDLLDVNNVHTSGYDMINTHHGRPNNEFRLLVEEEIFVNAWTVDLKSRFSQLWVLGINSITTNEPQSFLNMNEPILTIPQSSYILVWIVVDLVGITVVLVLRFVKNKKKNVV